MAAVTSLGNSFTTTAGNKTVTATPAVGDLIVVICANTGRTTAQPPTISDNNADGKGKYDLINSATGNTSADSLWIFVRATPVGSGTSTIFTMTQASDTGGGLDVLKVTGMSMGGKNSIRQSAVQNNGAAAGTPAPVFGVAALTGNACVGAVLNGTNPATMTPRASWTERNDLGYTVPTAGLETMSRDSGETGTTQTWGSTSASAFCALVAELDITVPVFDLSMPPMMGY